MSKAFTHGVIDIRGQHHKVANIDVDPNPGGKPSWWGEIIIPTAPPMLSGGPFVVTFANGPSGEIIIKMKVENQTYTYDGVGDPLWPDGSDGRLKPCGSWGPGKRLRRPRDRRRK